jgi:hypothetical protein
MATDVSVLQLHADVREFLNRQCMPRLKSVAEHSGQPLEDVRHVLTELQGFIELADEHDCTSDSRCANLLKLSLQDAYDSNTEQLADADVVAQWIEQHRKRGLRAHQLLRLVSFT